MSIYNYTVPSITAPLFHLPTTTSNTTTHVIQIKIDYDDDLKKLLAANLAIELQKYQRKKPRFSLRDALRSLCFKF